MDKNEIQNIEIDLLLEAVVKRYGYDYRDYSKASLKRRIKNFMRSEQLDKISEAIPRLLYDDYLFENFVYSLSVSVTEMFRDPLVYKKIREEIIPFLKTYPHVKIWHAGCASGEEVYSMAILLKEEGMYERAHIYATDINPLVLQKGIEGIYNSRDVQTFTENYNNSGGQNSFSDYYHQKYDSVIMDKELKKNITFSQHNLVTDSSFGEMHLILCRNVLIYFNKPLQGSVLDLFALSLVNKGFLCLGTKETTRFSTSEDKYNELYPEERIYQKKWR